MTTDCDQALAASSGDAGAYSSLYRRHIDSAWRLAQVTAASADAAARATTNAFVATLRRAGRGPEEVAELFRLHLLAAVYREAKSGSDRSSAAVTAAPDAPVVAAFTGLPSRWRAAVWLQEVEGLAATEAGPILGVSSAAALQLKKRGLAGLEHRLEQAAAGGHLPPDPAAALAAAVSPVPSGIATKTESRWRKAVAQDRRQSAAGRGWLAERAPRPLAVSVAGLCALGLVGLAVVGGSGTIHTLPVAAPAPRPPASGPPAAPAASGPGLGLGLGSGLGNGAPASGTGATTGGASPSGVATNQGPQLIASPSPSSASGAATTTAPVVIVRVPPVPVTLRPVTEPSTTRPPVTAPAVTLAPVAAAKPVVQVTLNAGPVGVNLGVGAGGCTGVQLLTLKVGCTGGAPGLHLGGGLVGGH